jgi:hypothetical protein
MQEAGSHLQTRQKITSLHAVSTLVNLLCGLPEAVTFKEWDLTGGLLWIHGKRSCFPHRAIFSATDGSPWL